jgi:hypothetical protein
MTALQACVDQLTVLAAGEDALVGQYNAASGKFDPAAFRASFDQVQYGNTYSTSSFLTNAGVQMGNFPACVDMNYYAFNYDALNSNGLTPNFCSTFGIGGVCLPSACNLVNGNFTFGDLQAEVVTLVKAASSSGLFEPCQASDANLVPTCAYLNSKFDYFTTLSNYLSFFKTLQGESSTKCFPDGGPDLEGESGQGVKDHRENGDPRV